MMFLGLSVVFSAGCSSEPAWKKTPPDEAFRRLLLNWMMDKRELVLSSLVKEDRQHIQDAHAAVVNVLPQGAGVPEPHEFLIASGVSTPFAIRKLSLAKKLPDVVKSGQQARVILDFHDGRQGEALMVWDGKAWLLRLGLARASA